MDYIGVLNEEQVAAVLHSDGPVLVSAGAGSGKTRALTYHISHLLLEKGVKPYNILAITFTNKAAKEVKERITAKLTGKVEFLSDMWVMTFHSMCARILRQNIDRIGYNSNFSIYADDETDRVLKTIIKDKALAAEGSKDDKLFKDAKFHISSAKNNAVDFEIYAGEARYINGMDKIAEIYVEYERRLKAANALDFDDLLVKTVELLANNPDVLSRYREKFKYIHVDEFQDTNQIQYILVKLLGGLHKNIFVVGDEDQSIYGWRGARFSNMQDFKNEFDAALYKLTQNYRSTGNILKAANSVIINNTARIEKTLWTKSADGLKPEYREEGDERAEAEFAATTIKYLVRESGCKYRDFAVLTRINALSRAFEEKFLSYGIPYKVFGGFKFFERKEIKDALAFLRIAVNPFDDEALIRAVGVLLLGIGAATVGQLRMYAGMRGISLFKVVTEIEDCTELKGAVIKKVLPFGLILKDIAAVAADGRPDIAFQNIIRRAGIDKLYLDEDEESISRRMNIDELGASVQEYCKSNPEGSLSDYLQTLALYSDLDDMADEADYTIIATVHAVKGLEFDTVFVAGMEDKIFPISRAEGNLAETEEERRLLYVAITRARKRLYLTRAQSRFMYGVRSFTLPSPFLREVEGINLKKKEPPRPEAWGEWGGSTFRNKGKGFLNNRYDDSGYQPDVEPDYFDDTTPAPARTPLYKKEIPPNLIKAVDLIKDSGFAPGDRVEHPKFGRGIISEIKDDNIAEINFEGFGKKTLSLAFAPLKKC